MNEENIDAGIWQIDAERTCPRCQRVCFTEAEFRTHPCFDFQARLDAEIEACARKDAPAAPEEKR